MAEYYGITAFPGTSLRDHVISHGDATNHRLKCAAKPINQASFSRNLLLSIIIYCRIKILPNYIFFTI